MKPTLALLIGLLGLNSTALGDAPTPSRPNILVIFTDDQASYALGRFNPEIQTPNLDRLADQGVVFTNAFNSGGHKPGVCVPSRMMLMTGLQLWKAAPHDPRADIISKTESEKLIAKNPLPPLWPRYLSEAGYQTYFTGKWHLPWAANQEFERVGKIRPGMPQAHPEGYKRRFLQDESDIWSPTDSKFGGFWAGGRHWTERTADEAIEFLTARRDPKRPFLMYVAFNAPHDPRQAPQEYVDKYPLEKVSLPTSFMPEYPYAKEIGCGPNVRDEKLAPFPRTPRAVQVNRQEYYAITSHLDTHVGRILDALEKAGLRENTYIIFTSDHGLSVGAHGLMGKQNLYDDSIKVPFILAGPALTVGRTIEAPIYLQDLMPTTLELAGVPIPQHVDFKSLLPLARGELSKSPHPAIYGAYMNLQRMVRSLDHKLLIYPAAGIVRLYDLRNDPAETRDLAGEPANRPLMDKLFHQLQELQQVVGDSLDLAPAYEAFFRKNSQASSVGVDYLGVQADSPSRPKVLLIYADVYSVS
jgi:choline-sulfatase